MKCNKQNCLANYKGKCCVDKCKGELNKLGRQANRVFKSNAFCPDCGQALDWLDLNANGSNSGESVKSE